MRYQLKKQDSWLFTWITLVIILLILIYHTFFILVTVSGDSMKPTLKDKEKVLIHKTSNIHRFDIVVAKEVEPNGDEKHVIKRVMGLPGDKIKVINGKVYVNDKRYVENYLDTDYTNKFNRSTFEHTVPKDYYFLIGDNRDNSKDSRIVGNFKKEAILGVKI